MDFTRRNFLRLAALSGVAAFTAPSLTGAAGLETDASRAGSGKAFELDEVTIGELQKRLGVRKLSAVSLAKKYLARIGEIDRNGPALRSILAANPEARAIAARLDVERKAKGPRGPLHGIPVLVKDNIATHDRVATTAGSLALEGCIAPRDAFLVRQLRAAGAVILGKTNLSEWANFRGYNSMSGWSALGGQTRHPYALDRNPSGSSSGSAVAVAANLSAVAVGTETDGSILSPSLRNGIVGIKPTVGLVSRAGIIPISKSQDTAGPMARTVTDAAILLGAMTGEDQDDSATAASIGKTHSDYTRFLDPDGLRGARIGIARETFNGHPQVKPLMNELVDEMKRRGAVLVDPVQLPDSGYDDAELEVFLYELKAGLNAYLATLGAAPVHTLREVIEFNEFHREREMPWFGQEYFVRADAKGPLTEPAYLEALAKCQRDTRQDGIDKLMDENKLDALFASGGGPSEVIDYAYGGRDTGGGGISVAAVAGYPSIAVPGGFINGLPVGVVVLGRAWSEPVLLRIAYAFEQATKARKPPRFLKTIEPERS